MTSYNLHILPRVVDNAKLVVDIGAKDGRFAALVHELNPTAKIICIEPSLYNIGVLKKYCR